MSRLNPARGGSISRILSATAKAAGDGHSSKPRITPRPLAADPDLLGLKRPRLRPESRWRAVPIWHCSRWGLPCPSCCQSGGGLLPHRFTLAPPKRGGLISVALSVGLPRPGVTRHRCFRESGLSSTCCPQNHRGHVWYLPTRNTPHTRNPWVFWAQHAATIQPSAQTGVYCSPPPPVKGQIFLRKISHPPNGGVCAKAAITPGSSCAQALCRNRNASSRVSAGTSALYPARRNA